MKYPHSLAGLTFAGLLALGSGAAHANKSTPAEVVYAGIAAGVPGGTSTAMAAVLSAGSPASIPSGAASSIHFADARDQTRVQAGREIYRTRCARCHGRRLEGQALWQVNDQFAHQRAPAHDETGHTWQHSDEELFHITRSGRLPGMPEDAKSFMPAFAGVLSDDEIVEVLAFIKARWSLGIRVSQATLNPGFAGMPEGADQVEWTLPPNCTGSLQSWKSEARR